MRMRLIHTASDRTPYTYVVRFPDGTMYYGVKYAKGCHPSHLGLTYFSSSNIVLRLIRTYGFDAVKFEVRKTFSSIDDAKRWETKLLKRVDARRNSKLLNKHNNDGMYPIDNTGCKNPMYKTRSPMKGRKHSLDSKLKIASALKANPPFKGRVHTLESIQKIKDKQRGENSNKFIGYYHTPHGVFGSSREAALPNLTFKAIQKWCKLHPDKKISRGAIAQSTYLKDEHVGKTFRELGFWFQSL